MTKKELLNILESVSDDAEIITVSNNYELKGNYVKAQAFKGNYKMITEEFRDDFDYEYYTTNVFKHDINANEVLIIRG